MSASAPFHDLLVLDLSQGLAGPYCAMLLAHYGADVVKLEPPGGDWARALGTRYGSHSALDIACSRGKLSLVLDLKTDAGRAAAFRIRAAMGRGDREFSPRGRRQARPRLRHGARRQRGCDLRVGQRLRTVWPVRRAAG